MEFSAGQIAELIGGDIEGDASVKVNDLSKIEEGRPGTITFLSNPAYTNYIYTTEASIAIVDGTFKPEKPLPKSLTLIKTKDARMAFTSLIQVYQQYINSRSGVHKSAVIDESVSVHESCYVGPNAVIERGVSLGEGAQIHANSYVGEAVKIGSKTIVHSGCQIGHHCSIGNECTLQPGAVIGGDGFGFAPNQANQYQKVVHIGNVVLEDHVEIGANTSIDRATIGSTVIRKGVKLDNLIQVAHNVEIGENTVIAAQTGIAGSTKIGKNCMIGGQVGIVGHIHIADEVKIAAQSGIGSSIETVGTIVQGSPAIPIGDFKRAYVHFRNLPGIANQVSRMSEEQLKANQHG